MMLHRKGIILCDWLYLPLSVRWRAGGGRGGRREENRGGVQEGSGLFTGLYGGQVKRKGEREKKCLEDHWL